MNGAADQLSNKHVCTGHLSLGLLREDKCFAAEIMHERGVRLASTREELTGMPHDDSATEEFIRKASSLPEDVVKLQTQIGLIVSRMEKAIANHDFAKARGCSDEERKEHDKLYLLYQKHRISDWLYHAARHDPRPGHATAPAVLTLLRLRAGPVPRVARRPAARGCRVGGGATNRARGHCRRIGTY